jgi:hypothetical protein
MPPAAPVPAEFVIATSDYKMDGDIAGPVPLDHHLVAGRSAQRAEENHSI